MHPSRKKWKKCQLPDDPTSARASAVNPVNGATDGPESRRSADGIFAPQGAVWQLKTQCCCWTGPEFHGATLSFAGLRLHAAAADRHSFAIFPNPS